jgi:hypothetical protein
MTIASTTHFIGTTPINFEMRVGDLMSSVPDDYKPASVAARSYPNSGRICFLISRSEAAHSENASQIDVVFFQNFPIAITINSDASR